MVDTVSYALATPDVAQPWAKLGLEGDEYETLRARLGRRPTACELEVVARLWTRAAAQPGPVGVVPLGDRTRIALGIAGPRLTASDEPAHRAAAILGGAVLGVLATGARPVAVLDAVGVDSPAHRPHGARDLAGLVAGLGGRAHRLGVPVVGGQTLLDPSFAEASWAAALCAGVLPDPPAAGTSADQLGSATVPAVADRVLVLHAADDAAQASLLEACQELITDGVFVAARAVGEGGLAAAAAALAASGPVGIRVDVGRLADPTVPPEETLLEESPGRVVVVVAGAHRDHALATCARWRVTATEAGEVTDTGGLAVDQGTERVLWADARLLVDGSGRERPAARPGWIDGLNADRAEALPRALSDEVLGAQLLAVAGSLAVGDRRPLTERFDRYAGGDTLAGPPESAGAVRLDDGSALVLSVGCAPRYALLNPYLGAQLALSEAYRDVAVTGAVPRAAVIAHGGRCGDHTTGWQRKEAALGLADASAALGIPIVAVDDVAGRWGEGQLPPTTLAGVLATRGPATAQSPLGFGWAGDAVLLLGTTREELSGSVWADVIHGHLGGMPPTPDLAAELALARVLAAAGEADLLSSAHGLAQGGLGQALVESCLYSGLGVSLTLPEGDPTVMLFAESPARVLVSLSGEHYPAVHALCAEQGVTVTRLGEVVDSGMLEAVGRFSLALEHLRARWEAPLREALASGETR